VTTRELRRDGRFVVAGSGLIAGRRGSERRKERKEGWRKRGRRGDGGGDVVGLAGSRVGSRPGGGRHMNRRCVGGKTVVR